MNQASKIGPTSDEKNKWSFNASEYNYRYHKFQKQELAAAKPAAVRLSDNRDTFQTGTDFTKNSSYENDYAAKPTTAPVRVKRAMGPSSIAPAAELKMDCNSSYRNSFDKKNARPAKTIRPPPPQGLQWVAGGASNVVNSVNMHVYRPYTAEEVSTAKREKIVILPEYGTIDTNTETKPGMDFNTTVKQNFVQHHGNCRPPPAPGAIKMPAHGIAGIAGADIHAKMDLTTTHRMVFNKDNSKIGMKNKEVAVAPLRKDKTGKVPGWYKSVEFADDVNTSTQMKDYCHHATVVRPKSFQPLHEYNPPETKFHTATLYKNAFGIKGNHKRKPMKPAARTKDDQIISDIIKEGNIYHTEYNRTFMEAPNEFSRSKPIVPKTTNRTTGKFYDGTSYRQNFNLTGDVKGARSPNFKPKKLNNSWYNNGSNEAQFISTTGEHYTGKFALPAEICKPKIKQDQVINTHRDADVFETEYNSCFESKPVTTVP